MSLTDKEKQIIRDSVPVLEAYGNDITTRFYQNMFKEHPELFNIFNKNNNTSGRQPRALANIVLQSAKYIDNLGALVPMVMLIAHKHKSLGVVKEQYPIVGEHLLRAIKEVLKEAATEELIEAWGKYYGMLAKIFIDAEESLYQQSENMEGGWRFTKEFVVEKKVKENSFVTSFYFKPKEGGPVPVHQGGQYIVVTLKMPGDEYISNRQYSLSDVPNNEYYRISVKREHENDKPGQFSNYLHDHIKEGDVVMLHAPSGEFTIKQSEKPIVLFAGGIGITPLLSMLKSLSVNDKDKHVTLVHSVREEVFYNEVMELKEKMPNLNYIVVSSSNKLEHVNYFGRVDEKFISENLALDSSFYICGPESYMKAVLGILKEKNVDPKNITYEFFGPWVPN